MIECFTPVDFQTKRAFNGKVRNIAVAFLAIGFVGIVAGIVVMSMVQQLWTAVFLVFLLPLAIGIYMMRKVYTAVNQVLDRHLVNQYLFDTDTFAVNVYENEQRIGQSIVNYSELIDVKEDKQFIYMFLNEYSAMPVLKSALSAQDLQQVRKWLGLK